MCWKEKIQWQSVTNGLRKEHVLRPPFLDKVLHHFFSYGYLLFPIAVKIITNQYNQLY
jgi:hypothetical protein